MPKRTFWLVTGVAMGAGTSLWAERRLRRSVQEVAARLHPDAIVAEVGRTARHAAGSTGERFRDALSSGRDEMQRREEELWADLAVRGAERDGFSDAVPERIGGSTRGRDHGTQRTARPTAAHPSAKLPLHLGK